MSRTELKSALKAYRENGYTLQIKLTASTEAMKAEYERIYALDNAPITKGVDYGDMTVEELTAHKVCPKKEDSGKYLDEYRRYLSSDSVYLTEKGTQTYGKKAIFYVDWCFASDVDIDYMALWQYLKDEYKDNTNNPNGSFKVESYTGYTAIYVWCHCGSDREDGYGWQVLGEYDNSDFIKQVIDVKDYFKVDERKFIQPVAKQRKFRKDVVANSIREVELFFTGDYFYLGCVSIEYILEPSNEVKNLSIRKN